MKRRTFFNTVIAFTTCLPLSRLTAEQMQGSKPNIQHEFKPGDKVPVSGVYDVIHDKVDGDVHALPHQLTLIAGTTFKRCRVCRGEVRFRLHTTAPDK